MIGARVLVCGGRSFKDRRGLKRVLDAFHANTSPVGVLIAGGAPGADSLAEEWATERRVPTWIFPAEWHVYGNAAGPRRNQQMIDDGKPDYVIAMPGGSGNSDMIRRARKAGIPTYVFDEDDKELRRDS